ncbi:MAG: radical SAM protein [Candidatus Fermentibacteraceae bacterium]|nr:radical SAM protein [Candidatus Fermentibacteraceae bacterium]
MVNPLEMARRFWGGDTNYMIFQITDRCNAACEHCFNWRKVRNPDNRELSLAEIEKLADKLPPMLLVNLCGGEPTMRTDLPEIVFLFSHKSKAKYITIPTNGFLPDKTEEIFGRIFGENPDTFFRIGISLDGWEEEHDRIRRHPGGFKKTLSTAKILQKIKQSYDNFFVEANIVFSRKTQDTIDDLVTNIHSTGLFDSIAVLYIRGNPENPQLMQPDLEKYKAVNQRIADVFRVERHPSARILEALTELVVEKVIEAETTQKHCFACYTVKRFFVLHANGDLYPCEILEDKLIGNVREHGYDIPTMLKSDVAEDIRQYAKSCTCTWECAINMSFIYNPLQSVKVVSRSFSRALGIHKKRG